MRTIFQWLRWVCLLLLGLAWTTTSSFAAVGALNQANGGVTIRYDATETQNRGYDAEPLRAWDNNPPVMVDASAFFGSPVQFNAAKTAPTSLWSKAEFSGTRVYQRNDLIDAALVDARGRSNLQRMQSGLAPIGPDGKSLNLHHTIQTADGPLAEMTATFHQQNSRVIHIDPNTIPSGIDRPAFDAFRRDYWMNRANDFSP